MGGRNRPARQVVEIDRRVKRILLHYVGLFRTYELAAQRIGVNRSTVAVYMEGAKNISLDVLERVIEVLQTEVEEAELKERHGADWRKDLFSTAQTRNFLQTDNRAYALTDGLHRFLDFYTSRFPNRVKAARSLDVNPRTYKAYVKHTISSFPASRFRLALDNLERRGVSRQEALDAIGVQSFEEILEPVSRPDILDLDDDACLARLLVFQRAGGTSLRQSDRPLHNLLERRFGGTTQAVEHLTSSWLSQVEGRLAAQLARGRVDRANQLLGEFEEVVRLVSRTTRSGRRGRGKHQPEYIERMRELVEQRLRLRAVLLSEAPLCHEYMAKDEFQQFCFRYRNLNSIQPYSPARAYHPGQLVHHASFGAGRVLELSGRGRMVVLFTGPDAPRESVTLAMRS